MSEATLAIRPGEIIYLDHERFRDDVPGEHQYVAALLTAPAFPGERHDSSLPYAVAAAQEYRVEGETETRWGWIHIPPESKAQIGDLLLKANATPGTWYWLLVSPHDDVFVSPLEEPSQ